MRSSGNARRSQKLVHKACPLGPDFVDKCHLRKYKDRGSDWLCVYPKSVQKDSVYFSNPANPSALEGLEMDEISGTFPNLSALVAVNTVRVCRIAPGDPDLINAIREAPRTQGIPS